MAERSTVAQVVQIGLETLAAPGTAVAASKRFQAISIEPTPNFETNVIRAAGTKFPVLAPLGKEWVTASLGGAPVYDELQYLLASALGTPIAEGVVTGTTGRRWAYTSANGAADTPRTFTVERGGSGFAERFVNGIVTELGLSFSRDGIEISGSMMGKRLETGITMTANPTALPLIPILPTAIDVFLDDTFGALGTTKYTRVLSADWTIGDRFNPIWTLDSAQQSWAASVEGVPSMTSTVTLEADATGMALLTTLRAGSTKYMRIRATGPQIGAGPATYSMIIDMPVKIVDSGGYGDEDGLQTIEWSCVGVADPAFTGGNAITAEVINTQTAL